LIEVYISDVFGFESEMIIHLNLQILEKILYDTLVSKSPSGSLLKHMMSEDFTVFSKNKKHKRHNKLLISYIDKFSKLKLSIKV
jgi:hypothetical protein